MPSVIQLFSTDTSAVCIQIQKDAYAVYHSNHRSLGTEQNRPMTFLSEVNFVSNFALLLFGGELELVHNTIIVDKWLKFKVSSDEEGEN